MQYKRIIIGNIFLDQYNMNIYVQGKGKILRIRSQKINYRIENIKFENIVVGIVDIMEGIKFFYMVVLKKESIEGCILDIILQIVFKDDYILRELEEG